MTNEKFGEEFLNDAKSLVTQRNAEAAALKKVLHENNRLADAYEDILAKYTKKEKEFGNLKKAYVLLDARLSRSIADNNYLRRQNTEIFNVANRGMSPTIDQLTRALCEREELIADLSRRCGMLAPPKFQ